MLPIGWMKLGLRARVCSQCRAVPNVADSWPLLAPRPCEPHCALFVQLPRLARLLERHHAKPPAGYEEFVLKLLCDSLDEFPGTLRSSHPAVKPSPFLEYLPEALATLERIVGLFDAPASANPQHDCARKALAAAQMSVHVSKSDIGGAVKQ